LWSFVAVNSFARSTPISIFAVPKKPFLMKRMVFYMSNKS
jgi:hypothetical protein